MLKSHHSSRRVFPSSAMYGDYGLLGHAISSNMRKSIRMVPRRMLSAKRSYDACSKKYKYPIYTLKVPLGKVYIACQPEVITAIEKNPKAVAFSPLAANVISRLSGVSRKTQDAMFQNIIGEDGEYGYFVEITKEVHATLRPGADLNTMIASVAKTTTNSVAQLRGKTARFNLHDWVQHAFSMGSTNAVYGPMNPFKDPGVESGFW